MDNHDIAFLFTLAALPVACGDDSPAATNGSTGPVTGSETTAGDEPSSEDAPTSETTAEAGDSESSGNPGSSTTRSDDSTTTGELSKEELIALCESYATQFIECSDYPLYYDLDDLAQYCLSAIDQYACSSEVIEWMTCHSTDKTCGDLCDDPLSALKACESAAAGCEMLPSPTAEGTLATDCSALAAVATQCIQDGYYIEGFSFGYQLGGTEGLAYNCEYGNYVDLSLTGLYPPPLDDIACGGAYEELVTCLSSLNCEGLAQAASQQSSCEAEYAAVRCRCDLEI